MSRRLTWFHGVVHLLVRRRRSRHVVDAHLQRNVINLYEGAITRVT